MDNQAISAELERLRRDIELLRYENEQLRQENEENLRRQTLIVSQQATLLAELSTPLILLTDDIVLMPLVGSIDFARAQQIMETLLEGITRHQTETAILDISGVSLVDELVAEALLRVSKAAWLLGAQVILSGISPQMARALIDLDYDLGRLVTHKDLRDSIAYLLNGHLAITRMQ